MARIGFVIIFFLISVKGYSQQQSYLILIDADNGQPFHVRIGDTIFNSSDIGHLTIAHLTDSTYNISIGFPKNQFREQAFLIKINKRDQGFQLRNLGNKNWTLYNWQTHEVKSPLLDTGANQQMPERGVKKDDAFSRLMSAVVNDTSVMYSAFVNTAKVKDSVGFKADSVQVVGEKNKKSILPGAVATTDSKEKKSKNNKYPFVRKIGQRSLPHSLRITYVDGMQEGSVDTVTMFIFFEKDTAAGADSLKNMIRPASRKKLAANAKNIKDSAAIKAMSNAKNPNANIVYADCKVLASDDDLAALRVSILVENTEENKIAAAKKSFTIKCYSVKQIRVLAELFANDEGRYKFFEAAYPYVSDRENCSQLTGLLTDNKYINQFKRMIGQ